MARRLFFDTLRRLDTKKNLRILLVGQVIFFLMFISHMDTLGPSRKIISEDASGLRDDQVMSEVSEPTLAERRLPPSLLTAVKSLRHDALREASGGPCRHHLNNVTIGHFIGGLGNQMWEMAAVYGVSGRHGHQAVLQVGMSKVDLIFTLPHTCLLPEGTTDTTTYEYGTGNPRRVTLDLLSGVKTAAGRSVRLDGYMQRLSYSWPQHAHLVREEFTFKNSVVTVGENLLREILPRPRDSVILVGIHVRHGDFLDRNWSELGLTIAPLAYIRAAKSLMLSRHGSNVLFLVATNDIPWCREFLQDDRTILMPSEMPNYPPELDMFVLSRCDHMIMTTGTFGWWSAMLMTMRGVEHVTCKSCPPPHDVVAYKNYPRDGSPIHLSAGWNSSDYFPPSWILLDDKTD